MEKKIREKLNEAYEIVAGLDAEKARNGLSHFSRWILYFQHERLIHLFVTVTFVILTFLCLIIFFMSENLYVIVLFLLLFIMSAAYIRHYYILENYTQRLYTLYDKMEDLAKHNLK